MIKRARLRLRIDSLDEEGAGVGSPAGLAGRALHVPFALPGEEVMAEVEHQSPHRKVAWGRLLEVLSPSPDRVEAECPAFRRCGGCALQHLATPRQLEWKRRRLEEALRNAGVRAPVGDCLAPDSPPRPYRNRSKLVFAQQDGRVVLGAYAPRSHDVVDLSGCAVVVPPLGEIADSIARFATELGIRPYDESTGEGDARYAILRAGRHGATQVLLAMARREVPGVRLLAAKLAAVHPELRGVAENLQPSRGNALIGTVEPDVVLEGEPDLIERVGDPEGVPIVLGPRSFFQASWAGANLLYRLAVERAAPRPGERVLELYCGVGGMSLLLARRNPEATVVGIEEIEEAVAGAEAARQMLQLDSVQFRCAEVASFLGQQGEGARADVVLVDPPRRGLAAEVTRALIASAPRRIVYVSCGPDTLARDLALLSAAGYRAGEVTPIDLMPDTAHVEAVVALDR